MRVKVYDAHFSGGWILAEIPFRRWLRLALLGKAFLRCDAKPGWRGKLPFYIVRCMRHGYFLDYPQGWDGHFYCPLCDREEVPRFSTQTGGTSSAV